MKRHTQDKKQVAKPLTLNRQTLRVIDDEVLHQVKGGGKAASSFNME
jgi:hypothetical protein